MRPLRARADDADLVLVGALQHLVRRRRAAAPAALVASRSRRSRRGSAKSRVARTYSRPPRAARGSESLGSNPKGCQPRTLRSRRKLAVRPHRAEVVDDHLARRLGLQVDDRQHVTQRRARPGVRAPVVQVDASLVGSRGSRRSPRAACPTADSTRSTPSRGRSTAPRGDGTAASARPSRARSRAAGRAAPSRERSMTASSFCLCGAMPKRTFQFAPLTRSEIEVLLRDEGRVLIRKRSGVVEAVGELAARDAARAGNGLRSRRGRSAPSRSAPDPRRGG